MPNDDIFFSDLPLDPVVTSTGDMSTVDNKESIKQSLRMIVGTARGSRIFASGYGSRIDGFLFEMYDDSTASRIGDEIRESIQNYERRIKLLDINVIKDDRTFSYEVEVSYQVINTHEVQSLLITLEKL